MRFNKALLLLLFITTIAASAGWAAERPNVGIIYGDDVGYGDVGNIGRGSHCLEWFFQRLEVLAYCIES